MILEIDENCLNIDFINALLSTNRKVRLQKGIVTRNVSPLDAVYKSVIRVEVEE
jgi:hypothetical protein